MPHADVLGSLNTSPTTFHSGLTSCNVSELVQRLRNNYVIKFTVKERHVYTHIVNTAGVGWESCLTPSGSHVLHLGPLSAPSPPPLLH